MNQILTWALFRDKLKREGILNDNSEDVFLLECANDVLQEICGTTQNSRDFRLNTTVNVSANPIVFPGFYLREIEQIYYERASVAPLRRWELTEHTGMICPAPLDGYPDSYTIELDRVTTPATYKIYVNPIGATSTLDVLRIIGTGFAHITDDTTLLPYVASYPMIQRSVLQRLQMKRNAIPDKVKLWDAPITRGGIGASQSPKDDGNSLAQETKGQGQ